MDVGSFFSAISGGGSDALALYRSARRFEKGDGGLGYEEATIRPE